MRAQASPSSATPASEWPPHELEQVKQCPVCQSENRGVLYTDLTDELFRCAPGAWTLQSCQSCSSAYLDPRPTPASIGDAYGAYFTHEDAKAVDDTSPKQPTEKVGWHQRIRDLLIAGVNGYRNARWGMSLSPAARSGRWWVPCIWPLRSFATNMMRNLPRRPPYPGARLLDAGCGNGSFLLLAQAAGWTVQGVDFDPLAVAAARRRGLDVRHGGLEQVTSEKYDRITCSHVIEHVHSPREWFEQMHALLNPNGTLWLQTPNIESLGHQKYDRHWRGLEPPRHLVLFNPESMQQLLASTGFRSTFKRLPLFAAIGVYAASEELREHGRLLTTLRLAHFLKLRFQLPSLMQYLNLSKAEFITCIAQRKN